MLEPRPELGRRKQNQGARQRRKAKSGSTRPDRKQTSSSKTANSMPSSELRPNKPKARVGTSNSHSRRGQTGSRQTASKKPTRCEAFELHSPDDLSLKQLIGYITSKSLNRFKTCVVTIIGKEPLNGTMRQQLVEALLPGAAKNESPTEPSDSDSRSSELADNQEETGEREPVHYENQVRGHVDFDQGLVVLTLDSFLDTKKLIHLSESLLIGDLRKRPQDRFTNAQLLMDSWPNWNQNLIKTLLILFTMSHLVVFYNPDPSIDYNFIHIFKLLEVLRYKSQNRICDLLETIASAQMFPQQWIRNCRIACPRALFICDTNYLDIDLGSGSMLAKVREDVEDQIYLLLKKSNLLPKSNQSNQQSLFSLPDQDDFVFILNQAEPRSLFHTKGNLEVEETPNDMITKIYNLSLSRSTYGNTHESDFMFGSQTSLDEEKPSEPVEPDEPTEEEINLLNQRKIQRQNQIRRFLQKHILSVQTAGMQETNHENKNTSKQHQSGHLLLPRFDDFFNVLMRMKRLMFPSQSFDEGVTNDEMGQLDSMSIWPTHDERRFVDIYDLTNTDDLFSQRHCQKARLTAFELYTRGLQMPPQDETIHKKSLESAVEFYNNHARGSAREANLQLLQDQCDRYWQDNRSGKREPSSRDCPAQVRNRLTRTHSSDAAPPNRRSHGQNQSDKSKAKNDALSVIRRSNGILVTSNCECGRGSCLVIKPSDRKKKLERVDIQRLND